MCRRVQAGKCQHRHNNKTERTGDAKTIAQDAVGCGQEIQGHHIVENGRGDDHFRHAMTDKPKLPQHLHADANAGTRCRIGLAVSATEFSQCGGSGVARRSNENQSANATAVPITLKVIKLKRNDSDQ